MLSSRVSLRTSRVAAVAPRARVAQRSAPRVSAVATPAPAGEPSNNNSNKLSIVQSSRKASSIVTKTSSGDAAASEPEFLGIAKSTMMKVVPLTLMMFCILFNYTILRDTKDVLVVTAPGSGAEIIPFLKTYVNLPAAIGFAALYATLCNKFEQGQIVIGVISTFLGFFAAFAWVLYPNIGSL